jgi:hypothetical protein
MDQPFHNFVFTLYEQRRLRNWFYSLAFAIFVPTGLRFAILAWEYGDWWDKPLSILAGLLIGVIAVVNLLHIWTVPPRRTVYAKRWEPVDNATSQPNDSQIHAAAKPIGIDPDRRRTCLRSAPGFMHKQAINTPALLLFCSSPFYRNGGSLWTEGILSRERASQKSGDCQWDPSDAMPTIGHDKRHVRDADLALYAAGDLPVYRRASVWLHTHACESCQAKIVAFQADRKVLLSAVGELSSDVVWDRLAAEMTANIHLGLAAGACAPQPRRF